MRERAWETLGGGWDHAHLGCAWEGGSGELAGRVWYCKPIKMLREGLDAPERGISGNSGL